MAKKKEKKAGKRMKKKELANILMDFFHTKQEEVISLKYLFAELHLTTHPLKMLCMDILADMLADDYTQAVEVLFPGVKVAKVNTVSVRGRFRRQGMHAGYTAASKKAIVTLTKDSKEIEFFNSMV